MSQSTINLDSSSPTNTGSIHFNSIWSVGSTSSGASTFTGTDQISVSLPTTLSTCEPLHIGTDVKSQKNDPGNILQGMLHLANLGTTLLVNSIGYSIDGGKTDEPGPCILEVTSPLFKDKSVVGIFAQIVNENPTLQNKFYVFNRNYRHPNGNIGGQWANLGTFLLEQMNIPNYQRYEYIADVGGGSVTFYQKSGEINFKEYKNVPMFMNKKNQESPNQCYTIDRTGSLFVSKFHDQISKYPEFTRDNLLVLQTGKMREDGAPIPDFNFNHYYMDHYCEVESESVDLVASLTRGAPTNTISFSHPVPFVNKIVNVHIHAKEPEESYLDTLCDFVGNMFHVITCGFFL